MPGVEEVLRLESSVQFLPTRTALADIEIAGTIIPKGSPIFLVLRRRRTATRSGSRTRTSSTSNARTTSTSAWASGIHSCFGGPLARLEVQIAVERVPPPRREPAAGRRPAAVPPQPDLPRPETPAGRHRRDPRLNEADDGHASVPVRRVAEAAGAPRGRRFPSRAGAGPGQDRRGRRLPLRPAPHGGAPGRGCRRLPSPSATRTRAGSRSSGRARPGSRPGTRCSSTARGAAAPARTAGWAWRTTARTTGGLGGGLGGATAAWPRTCSSRRRAS